MVRLRRTVRFAVGRGAGAGGGNGFAGVPAMEGLGRHYEIVVACEGEPDPVTGYLIDIKRIDEAVRGWAVPVVARAAEADPQPGLAEVVAAVRSAVAGALRGEGGVRVVRVELRLSPYHAVAMGAERTSRVVVRQMFDFAAAHRLHVAALSAEENRRIFGKCNNPSGHGHNYRVEVAVEMDAGRPLGLGAVEEITNETLIRRFDHKHLNEDTEEFGEGGVQPTVENIARVFFGLLAPRIADLGPGAALAWVTVWETDRTCCTYPAGADNG